MSKNLPLQGAGFTLVELMIVLSLLSVLGAMGVNSLLQWQWRTHYLKTLNHIVTAVQHAQQSAQRGHHDYWFSVEAQCMWLHTETVGNCHSHAVVLSEAAIRWQANFSHGQQLRFVAGRGLSGFGAGRIRVFHHRFPHHEAAVIVSSLGRVRVCENEQLLRGVSLC